MVEVVGPNPLNQRGRLEGLGCHFKTLTFGRPAAAAVTPIRKTPHPRIGPPGRSRVLIPAQTAVLALWADMAMQDGE